MLRHLNKYCCLPPKHTQEKLKEKSFFFEILCFACIYVNKLFSSFFKLAGNYEIVMLKNGWLSMDFFNSNFMRFKEILKNLFKNLKKFKIF